MCVVTVLASELYAQAPPASSPLDHASPLVIGHTLTLHSSILDEDRRLLFYLPAGYEASELPLPVIYLLDGRANFRHTTATVDLLVVNGRMPRSMVVGIANIDRNRDFAATVSADRPPGGAARFLEFIETELIPFVDENFPTAKHRTLIGHSLGGSFVFHALVERPGLFDAAIAISPAIADNHRTGEDPPSISDGLVATLENEKARPVSLFITMSDGEDQRWEDGLKTVIDGLEANGREAIRWEFRRMEGEDHGTTVQPSTFFGLRFINADWDTRGLVGEGSLAEIIDRFQGLSERLGFELHPPEVMINFLGYRLLGEGRGREAIEAFEYNTAAYPESANVYDSLGEALEMQGRLPGALRNYRKAVAKAEADDDRLAAIFRGHLQRVESLLYQGGSESDRVFETPSMQLPEGGV